jgi:hypothetical protein
VGKRQGSAAIDLGDRSDTKIDDGFMFAHAAIHLCGLDRIIITPSQSTWSTASWQTIERNGKGS